MTQEYDVFVSFKNLDSDGKPTRDSQIAKEVYRHLTSLGMAVFFSNISLETLGIAQYKKAIDDALDAAHTLVAVGTSGENLNSQWVRYEWDSFFNDILSGFKPKARVFAYIEDAEPKDLPRALRQTQTFIHGPDSLDQLCRFIENSLERDNDHADPALKDQQCPRCLAVGKMVDAKDEFDPPDSVRCTHVFDSSSGRLEGKPCGFTMSNADRGIPALTISTVGTLQVGKTHWLLAVCDEIQSGRLPDGWHAQLLPSRGTSGVNEMQNRIREYKASPDPTDDILPEPVPIWITSNNGSTRIERIAYLLDFSCEVTHNPRHHHICYERLNCSDGYILVVDPTEPMEPQRENFAHFIADLRGRIRAHTEPKPSPPVAICVSKLDLIQADTENPMSNGIKQLGERIDSMSFSVERIDSQSDTTLEALSRIWPDWRIDKQIAATLGSRSRFFPIMHPLRSDGVAQGEHPSSPALKPLIWLLQQLSCNPTETGSNAEF